VSIDDDAGDVLGEEEGGIAVLKRTRPGVCHWETPEAGILLEVRNDDKMEVCDKESER
jgi:hypothetical protein